MVAVKEISFNKSSVPKICAFMKPALSNWLQSRMDRAYVSVPTTRVEVFYAAKTMVEKEVISSL